MQQRTRRLAFVFGGTLLATLATLAACSTDNGTTPTPGGPTTDSGKKTDAKANPDPDGSNPQTGDAGDGGGCAKVPTVKSSVGPYCQGVLDASADGAAKGVNCNSENNEICCADGPLAAGGFAPSECRVAAPAAEGYVEGTCGSTYTGDGGKEYHCTEADHCPGSGESCCAVPQDGVDGLKPGNNDDFPGCKAYYQSGRFVAGSRCKAGGCAPGDLTLCASDDECKSGAKCYPISIEGRFTGYCRL